MRLSFTTAIKEGLRVFFRGPDLLEDLLHRGLLDHDHPRPRVVRLYDASELVGYTYVYRQGRKWQWARY